MNPVERCDVGCRQANVDDAGSIIDDLDLDAGILAQSMPEFAQRGQKYFLRRRSTEAAAQRGDRAQGIDDLTSIIGTDFAVFGNELRLQCRFVAGQLVIIGGLARQAESAQHEQHGSSITPGPDHGHKVASRCQCAL